MSKSHKNESYNRAEYNKVHFREGQNITQYILL